MVRPLYLPPVYPEQSADHEFPADVVELVRAAADSGEVRRTWIETGWHEKIPAEQLPIGRPIRTEGRRGHRITHVAVDALAFEAPRESVDNLILDLVPKLRERSYTAYGALGSLSELTPPDYKSTWTAPSQEGRVILTVVQCTDPYEPLRIEGPGGGSIPGQDLFRALEEWKRFSSFEIVIAHNRVMELAFRSLPPKLPSFAKSVYDLNPDVIREVLLVEPRDGWDTIDYIRAMDAQTIRDLVRHLRKTMHLTLVWS